MKTHPFTRWTRRCGVGLLATLFVATLPARAVGQTPAVKYQRAQAREKAARTSSATTPATLRAVARAYEAIVRAHPRSGYSDNALWQAAGLYIVAFDKTGARSDRDLAVKMLTWLKREYPTSSLVKQVSGRLASIDKARPTSSPSRVAKTPPPAAPRASPPPVARAEPRSPPDEPASAPVVADAAPAPPPAPEAGTTVRSVTYSRLPKGDRLTIELNQEAVYSTTRSASPDRLTIDLINAGFAPSVAQRVPSLTGSLFTSAEITRTAHQATRLVLDVTGSPRYSTFPLYNPFRLVVDVESDEPEATAASSPIAAKVAPPRNGPLTVVTPTADAAPAPAPPSATGQGDFSMARQLGLGVARVVIDPGHGGHDPGAQANGVTEAGLVLDIALRLEKLLLAQPEFEVVLTRRTDTYIPLEERTAIAQRESADMFLSIHGNSSPRATTRGIETYFLDFASNPQAEAVAARENAASAQPMRLLPELVKAITLNNKVDESRELARQVQESMVRRLAGPNKAIKDFGVKRAPFVVLIGAEMPSVLAEVSFLTNRSDATLLKQAAHRQRIAQALADGIQAYRSSLKKIGAVAAN